MVVCAAIMTVVTIQGKLLLTTALGQLANLEGISSQLANIAGSSPGVVGTAKGTSRPGSVESIRKFLPENRLTTQNVETIVKTESNYIETVPNDNLHAAPTNILQTNPKESETHLHMQTGSLSNMIKDSMVMNKLILKPINLHHSPICSSKDKIVLKTTKQHSSSHFQLKKKSSSEEVKSATPHPVEEKKIVYTIRDLDIMPLDLQIVNDNRTFLRFYLDSLMYNHSISFAFVLKSSLVPQNLRVLSFFSLVNITSLITSLLIDVSVPQGMHMKSKDLQICFTSSILGLLITFMLKLILCAPKSIRKEFEEALSHQDDSLLKEKHDNYLNKMKLRHYSFTLVSLGINLISMFYIMSFTNLYNLSSKLYEMVTVSVIVFQFIVIELLVPLFFTLCRLWCLRWKIFRYVYSIHYAYDAIKYLAFR